MVEGSQGPALRVREITFDSLCAGSQATAIIFVSPAIVERGREDSVSNQHFGRMFEVVCLHRMTEADHLVALLTVTHPGPFRMRYDSRVSDTHVLAVHGGSIRFLIVGCILSA